LDGRFFDCSVHALDLAIRPWMSPAPALHNRKSFR
jgi:hypothetical protein